MALFLHFFKPPLRKDLQHTYQQNITTELNLARFIIYFS